MTTTCALDESLDPEPDELLDDDPFEPVPEPPAPPAPPPPEPPPELAPPELPLPELPELPDPDTCWPAVRFTDATTPSIGEVSLASPRAPSASATWFWAAVTAASSAASCSEVIPDPDASSDDTFALSEASVAFAWATLAASEAEFTVASTCPAATFCPTLTATEVTSPDAAKLRFAWLAGWIVPVEDAVCRSVLDAAATS